MGPSARDVTVTLASAALDGRLTLPEPATGLVLFAHGSGSSRLSPRNGYVAGVLQRAGLATLRFDLLTRDEDEDYATRFDIALLTERLVGATDWVARRADTAGLPVGYFGASTGAAAALRAAAALGDAVAAVVSRGGRPDLAGADALSRVRCPTLLLVGGLDTEVIRLNEAALARLAGPKALRIVPGASHLFEEAGTLETVAAEAERWFSRHLPAARPA